MKTYYTLTLIFLLFFSNFLSQNFTSDYICTYKLSYDVRGKKENEQFIMFINAKENKSYFLSSINYVSDTINISDPMILASYDSDFNERILKNKNNYNTYENVKGVKIFSEEKQDLNWEILNKMSKDDNITMQLAKTKAYGRIWYAWFSKDIPIDFGPYKFNGLPGMIVKLYDENHNFDFSLQNFKKKRKTINLPNINSYKKILKKDFNKSRFKIQTTDDGVVIFDNSNDRQEWQKNLEKRYTSIPILDISYPYR